MPIKESVIAMGSSTNGSRFRQVLLDIIRETTRNGAVSFSPEDVMQEAIKKLNAFSDEALKRAVLCYFNELLRTGVVGLGDPKEVAVAGRSFRGGSPWPNGTAHLT